MVNASSFLGPLHFVKPVYGYVMPLLVLLTSICNLIIILVLSRCLTPRCYDVLLRESSEQCQIDNLRVYNSLNTRYTVNGDAIYLG